MRQKINQNEMSFNFNVFGMKSVNKRNGAKT